MLPRQAGRVSLGVMLAEAVSYAAMSDPPAPRQQTRIDRHVAVPMRDGVRLSAAFHWPPRAPEPGVRYPAVIEYHPYRKDDRSALRAWDHDYFASHGYVSVRLDVRGTGSSEGVNTDEYMLVETRDGYDAIEWLAQQPWCDGNVGMFGSSYGGFTCFQVATLQPPHLQAIAPIYATDDRYTDDCHYKGGAFKAYYDTGTYGTMMVALNALPPDPDAWPDRWEQMWKERFDLNEPYMQVWLANQTDGPYWRPGSLKGQYEKVKAATFIIGGWQDGYPNPPGRAFANLRCPRKLLIGPWNHSRPDVATPGPRIHYLREIRRWFDLWLRGVDDGASKEPPVTFYVQSYDRPDPSRRDTTGYWRSEQIWPSAGARWWELHLRNGRLPDEGELAARPPRENSVASLRYDPAVGLQGGLWSGGLPFGLPGDQRPDEALSLVYTGEPLRDPVTVAGNPMLQARVSSSAPVTLFVAKLSDVSPDGTSALVTRGVLNGTRRNGMGIPEAMDPGREYTLEIELDATAWQFEAGHRVRLAISASDFPNSWPTPMQAVITVRDGGNYPSSLSLPVIAGSGLRPPAFEEPPEKPDMGAANEAPSWETAEDVLHQTVSVHIRRSGGNPTPAGGRMESSDELSLTLNRRDPAGVHADGTSKVKLEHPRAGVIEASARQQIRSGPERFVWRVDLEVKRDGETWGRRTWEQSFRRELL